MTSSTRRMQNNRACKSRSPRSIAGWKQALVLVIAGAVLAVAAVGDADARRLGGSRSFGRQAAPPTQPSSPPARSDLGQQKPSQAAPAQPATPPAAQPARNRWLGPLGGLVAGLGIAALLSHFGLMGPFAEMLGGVLLIGLLVIAALFLWRLLRGAPARPLERRMEPAYNAPGGGGGWAERETPQPRRESVDWQPAPVSGEARPGSVASTLGGVGTPVPLSGLPRSIPAGFDVEAFLRSAKVHFHRLQAAWDRKDLNDLSEFTTPEVFAELRVQVAEDEGRTNQTEVVALDAELLGVDEGPVDWLASVRFTGTLRENPAQPAAPFQEIWNLSKPKDGRTGWLLAGIQQVQ